MQARDLSRFIQRWHRTTPKDVFSLTPAENQQAIVRDGVPALISAKRNVVFLRPVAPKQESHERPRFVVALFNKSKSPATFSVSDIRVTSSRPRETQIKVYTHSELADEVERARNTQLALGILSGAAGAVSAASAGNSYTTGSFAQTSRYGTSYGTYSSQTYSPALTQAALDANNQATLSNLAGIEAQAQSKLSELQATIIKDHTLMPGEWHGAVIVLAQPEMGDAGAEYRISLRFDGEEHTFAVNQRGA